MKFNTCLLALALLPFFAVAQVPGDMAPAATSKGARFELSPLSFTGLSAANKLAFQLSGDGQSLYLTVSGGGWGAATVDAGDLLILRFSNDSSVALPSAKLQSFEPDILQNTYSHLYLLTPADLQKMYAFPLVSLRKYSFKSFTDLPIPAQNSEKLKSLSARALAQLAGKKFVPEKDVVASGAAISVTPRPASRPSSPETGSGVMQIKVEDIRSHIGDSVFFCSTVWKSEYQSQAVDKPTVLTVQAAHAATAVNLIIWGKYRNRFASPPEKRYANKAVCVSGVVKLRANIPYINIRELNQIKVTGPVNLAEVALFEGDSITVAGRVFNASYPVEEGAKPTLLSMGAAFPNQSLTLVINEDERKNFGLPETKFLQKSVRVTGKVQRYKNEWRMVLYNDRQVEVLPVQDSVRTFVEAPGAKDTSQLQAEAVPGQQHVNGTPANAPQRTEAEFPGGYSAFSDYLEKNLSSPSPLKTGEQKQVVASFIIDDEGVCDSVEIVASAGSAFDDEVKRVLQAMPKWKPATDGEVRHASRRFTWPFLFKAADVPAQKGN